MMRTVRCLIVFLLLVMGGKCLAEGRRLEEHFAELEGQRVLYSSPYLEAKSAEEIDVRMAELSEDFADDGIIVLNGKNYPVDQMFMLNSEGVFENLASLYVYGGVGQTFLVRYYDKERLAVADEKAKLLADAARCVKSFEEGGADGVSLQAREQSLCLDGVFERFVKLFYNYSKDDILTDYREMVKRLRTSFEGLASADFCYGKCGTVASMRAAQQAVDMQAVFVRSAIESLEIGSEL